jgi:hypothetical protein
VTISASEATVPVSHTDRFFIGGRWVTPSSDSTIDVIDSHTEQVYLTVAEAPGLRTRSGPPTCAPLATRS